MEEKIELIIVEDHKIVRDGLKAMLLGVQDIRIVAEAENGNSFFTILEEKTADIIILDIGLPDISGISIAKKLSESHPNLKVIILTANTDDESIIGAVEVGALGILSKDTSKEEFLSAVRKVYNGGQYFSDVISKIIYAGLKNAIHKPKETKIKLTQREIEVVKLISEGLSYKEIANELSISSRTVETHRNNILEKTQLKNNIDIVKYAIKSELIEIK